LALLEQSVVDHVGRGEWLDLAGNGPVDEAVMRSWGASRVCRASVIRDILTGKLAAGGDPHGVRLRGARITGRLDLENVTSRVHLELKDCFLEEGVLAQGAGLGFVGLAGCLIEHPAEPPLAADRLTCSVLDLRGTKITGHAGGGAVRLAGARIEGSLDCDGAAWSSGSGAALFAYGLQVGLGMFLRAGFTCRRRRRRRRG
jgi:hypothetical protein